MIVRLADDSTVLIFHEVPRKLPSDVGVISVASSATSFTCSLVQHALRTRTRSPLNHHLVLPRPNVIRTRARQRPPSAYNQSSYLHSTDERLTGGALRRGIIFSADAEQRLASSEPPGVSPANSRSATGE